MLPTKLIDLTEEQFQEQLKEVPIGDCHTLTIFLTQDYLKAVYVKTGLLRAIDIKDKNKEDSDKEKRLLEDIYKKMILIERRIKALKDREKNLSDSN